MFQGRIALLNAQGNILGSDQWVMDRQSERFLQELAERITVSGQLTFLPVDTIGGAATTRQEWPLAIQFHSKPNSRASNTFAVLLSSPCDLLFIAIPYGHHGGSPTFL